MIFFNTSKVLDICARKACKDASKQPMHITIRKVALRSTVALFVLSGCSTMSSGIETSAQAKQIDQPVQPVSNLPTTLSGPESFRRSVYAATGVGASRLTPDKSGISSWSVSDKVNTGGQITIGADINRHLSLELHSADLGSAGVEQFGGPLRGRINYHMHGGSVLWYAGKNRHNNKRRGLTGYARGGVAMMNNSPVGSAPYSQRNSTQLLIGAGVEYATKIGLGLRAEAISFDSDAQYAQLGLIYRLGKKSKPIPAPVLEVKTETIEQPIATLAVAKVVPVTPLDTDGDGVIDTIDQCKDTKAGALVDAVGCAVFQGTLEGVNFYSASERLTPEAQAVLDRVAVTLQQYPRAKINVNAHTDSKGSNFYNQNLSKRRAKMVVQYLGYKGVDTQNLIPTAFGETKPIASNDTSQGRAINRRVELEAFKH